MDYHRKRLDECIFDYLASHPDTFIPIRKIFLDITGDTGFRCSVLTDSLQDRQYFTSICYGLNSRYANILKRKRDGSLFLAFEKANVSPDYSLNNHTFWDDIEFNGVIKCVCDNNMHRDYKDPYFSLEYNDEPLIHELIRYGSDYSHSFDLIESLIQDRKIDTDCVNHKGQNPLDVAIEVKNKEVILLLTEKEHLKKPRDVEIRLKHEIDQIKTDACRDRERYERYRQVDMYSGVLLGLIIPYLWKWSYEYLTSP